MTTKIMELVSRIYFHIFLRFVTVVKNEQNETSGCGCGSNQACCLISDECKYL